MVETMHTAASDRPKSSFFMIVSPDLFGRYEFGSPAILSPSGGLPWHLGGSEDPWLSVPVFRRVWLCRCCAFFIRLAAGQNLIVNIIRLFQAARNVRFGSLAALRTYSSPTAASGGKAAVQERIFRIKIVGFSDRALNVRFSQ